MEEYLVIGGQCLLELGIQGNWMMAMGEGMRLRQDHSYWMHLLDLVVAEEGIPCHSWGRSIDHWQRVAYSMQRDSSIYSAVLSSLLIYGNIIK